MQNIIDFIIPIIREAGKIMLSAHCSDNDNDIEVKAGDANFVTVFDVKIQEYIINSIKSRMPEALFIAEEKENDEKSLKGEYCFIIDPIDGTTNFIHEYKQSSISLAIGPHSLSEEIPLWPCTFAYSPS